MKYVVIAVCIILILLAIYIAIRTIGRSLKGKCCDGCKGCSSKEQCTLEKKEK